MQIDKEVVERISALQSPKVVAVSGLGGSGKSTFAKQLGAALGAPIVGVDSFQKKGVFDTNYVMWEIMDFDRLKNEVLQPFINNQSVIRYGHFDAKTETIMETVEMMNGGVLVVEGVGLFRPELMRYFKYKIWVDEPIEVAIARGKKRDREDYGNPTDKLWDGVWKDNDLQYVEEYKPKEVADLVINND